MSNGAGATHHRRAECQALIRWLCSAAHAAQRRTQRGVCCAPAAGPHVSCSPRRAVLTSMVLQVGQKYDAHHDFFYHPSHVLKGGNRVATVIVSVTVLLLRDASAAPPSHTHTHDTCCLARKTPKCVSAGGALRALSHVFVVGGGGGRGDVVCAASPADVPDGCGGGRGDGVSTSATAATPNAAQRLERMRHDGECGAAGST